LVHLLGGKDGEEKENENNTKQVRKLFTSLFNSGDNDGGDSNGVDSNGGDSNGDDDNKSDNNSNENSTDSNVNGALFTELSVLISDPGAPRQQLHPDKAYQTICPSFTCFVALQDITNNMGPTVFLPKTNTKQCHLDFNNEVNDLNNKKENDVTEDGDWFIKSREWSISLLNQGDVQILDSRTIHAATANNTIHQRRSLLYFTFKNPLCVEYGMPNTPEITKGSLYDDINLCFGDYNKL
jgi:hypothetical protein